MNNAPQLQHLSSDEIDLFELFGAIWKQKTLVIGCTLVMGLLGVSYAYLAPKVYQVSSVLRPAALNELDALNRSEVYKLPPADALAKVAEQLDSYETRLGFFRANPVLFEAFQQPGRSLEQSFETFNNNAISLVMPDPKTADGHSIRLELQYPNSVDGVAILNGFVAYALARQQEQVGADFRGIVNNRLSEIKGKIEAARASYETDKASQIARLLEADKIKRAQLHDELSALRLQMETQRTSRLAELAEAISIAKAMGIKTPTTPSAMGAEALRGSSQVMRTEVTNQRIPMYFMGTEALEAERAALERRTNSDFTSPRIAEIGKELHMLEVNRKVEVLGSRENQDMFLYLYDVERLWAEETRLRSLNTDMSTLKLVTVDRQAQEPLGPIKPKKLLIIVLSLLVGLMLGVVVALIRYFVRVRRQNGPFSVYGERQLTPR